MQEKSFHREQYEKEIKKVVYDVYDRKLEEEKIKIKKSNFFFKQIDSVFVVFFVAAKFSDSAFNHSNDKLKVQSLI